MHVAHPLCDTFPFHLSLLVLSSKVVILMLILILGLYNKQSHVRLMFAHKARLSCNKSDIMFPAHAG